MKIREIAQLVNGTIVCGEKSKEEELTIAFTADLMSDVLTVKIDNLLLITGLANVQTIRTAEMSDIKCLLFTRNKTVTPEMIEIAEDNDMVLIQTSYSSFRTSGILFGNGIKPVY
jgi:predicted transcriptional regulator